MNFTRFGRVQFGCANKTCGLRARTTESVQDSQDVHMYLCERNNLAEGAKAAAMP